MKKSFLKGKVILVVEDDPHVLAALEEKIKEVCPDCFFDKATTYKEATERMASWTYDLVILDGMGVRGFDLLKNAVVRGYPAVMLSAPALGPETFRQYFETGARACHPKEKMGETVSFLEDILRYRELPVWRRLFTKLEGFLENWREKSGINFWAEMRVKTKKMDY